MNIAFISPHTNGCGCTTLASLVALQLASKSKTTCLVNSKAYTPSIYQYLGIRDYNDKSGSIATVANLIKEDALRKEEIGNYCRQVAYGLEVFCSTDMEMEQVDMDYILEYVCTLFPHEYIVFDMDDKDMFSVSNTTILDHADCAIIVLRQNYSDIARFKDMKDDILEAIGGIPLLTVVNGYTDIACSIKELAMEMGISKPKNWIPVRYNGYVGWGCFKGKLQDVLQYGKSNDTRVIDIAKDIDRVAAEIQRVKTVKKSKGASRKGR